MLQLTLTNREPIYVYSLLLLTRNVNAQEQITGPAELSGIRTRVVSTFDSAEDWLSRQKFDVFLIDLDLEPGRSAEILNLAWKYSPSLTSAAFSIGAPPLESWEVTLLGVKIFRGPKLYSDLEAFLEALPKQHQLASPNYSAVLFVEDLDSPREIVETYIKSLGFEHVDAVGSAKDALKKLHLNPLLYFCIVADIHMPVMNGIRLTEEIRNTPTLAHIPVIILTADPTAENVVECVRAGASGFLAKPPKKKELLRELEKAKRMLTYHHSPRLCSPEEASMLQSALKREQSRKS